MARSVTVIPARSQKVRTGHKAVQEKKIRVAAYCRVSTDQEDQLHSFEAQVEYYTKYINEHENYEMAGIYADEGISGTNTKKREQFKKMIADCEDGKIDLVITKSISRFARNTQDCLAYSRKLKNLGIGIIFEKENINTLDSTGELLFTILSSLHRMNQETFQKTVNGASARNSRTVRCISTHSSSSDTIRMRTGSLSSIRNRQRQ